MSLSIGIIGLPNVGKSTLFNALMKSRLAEAANYAFTTIEPNVGVVELPDERLYKIKEISQTGRIVPTTIKFIDIAGLIAGAHKGEGLGNKFLSHIREVEAIAMVIRLFEDKEVAHVTGELNPKSDIETILLELVLADYETLSKRKAALEKAGTSSKKIIDAYVKIEKILEKNRPAVETKLTDEEKEIVGEANFLTLKPFLYVFNVPEAKATETPEDLIEAYGLKDLVKPDQAVVISAKIESELSELPDTDQAELMVEYGLDESGLNRLVKTAYKTLDLIPFFTVNPKEASAWTIQRGTKAPQAAGKVHTDFEKKFIKAEVVNFKDLMACGGWHQAKEKGKVRLEGKDYIVKDGDVIYIHHG